MRMESPRQRAHMSETTSTSYALQNRTTRRNGTCSCGWEAFEQRYIYTSHRVMDAAAADWDVDRRLPELFIRKVVETLAMRWSSSAD